MGLTANLMDRRAMNEDFAIRFDHVGKLYRLGVVGTGTLSHDLNRWWQTRVLHREDPT